MAHTCNAHISAICLAVLVSLASAQSFGECQHGVFGPVAWPVGECVYGKTNPIPDDGLIDTTFESIMFDCAGNATAPAMKIYNSLDCSGPVQQIFDEALRVHVWGSLGSCSGLTDCPRVNSSAHWMRNDTNATLETSTPADCTDEYSWGITLTNICYNLTDGITFQYKNCTAHGPHPLIIYNSTDCSGDPIQYEDEHIGRCTPACEAENNQIVTATTTVAPETTVQPPDTTDQPHGQSTTAAADTTMPVATTTMAAMSTTMEASDTTDAVMSTTNEPESTAGPVSTSTGPPSFSECQHGVFGPIAWPVGECVYGKTNPVADDGLIDTAFESIMFDCAGGLAAPAMKVYNSLDCSGPVEQIFDEGLRLHVWGSLGSCSGRTDCPRVNSSAHWIRNDSDETAETSTPADCTDEYSWGITLTDICYNLTDGVTFLYKDCAMYGPQPLLIYNSTDCSGDPIEFEDEHIGRCTPACEGDDVQPTAPATTDGSGSNLVTTTVPNPPADTGRAPPVEAVGAFVAAMVAGMQLL